MELVTEGSGRGKFRGGKPHILRGRITEPMDQILEFTPEETRVENRLDLIMFISIKEIRGWTGEVGSMSGSFLV